MSDYAEHTILVCFHMQVVSRSFMIISINGSRLHNEPSIKDLVRLTLGIFYIAIRPYLKPYVSSLLAIVLVWVVHLRHESVGRTPKKRTAFGLLANEDVPMNHYELPMICHVRNYLTTSPEDGHNIQIQWPGKMKMWPHYWACIAKVSPRTRVDRHHP